MLKKLTNFLLLALILIFVVFNKKIIPIKREITQLQLVQSIGLDIGKDNSYKLSVLSNQKTAMSTSPTGASGGDSSKDTSSSNSSSSAQKVTTVEALSFSDALRNLEGISTKYVTLSHVKYIIVGESAAKSDISTTIDFIARNQQSRMNASVYIVKGNDADYLIKNESSNDADLSDRLNSMEKDSVLNSIALPRSILDVMNILTSDSKAGVIPALEIVRDSSQDGSAQNSSSSNTNNSSNSTDKSNNSQSGSEDKIEPKMNNTSEKDIILNFTYGKNNFENYFDYDGYGVISNNKLIGYIDREESVIYNMLKNDSYCSNIEIKKNNDQLISFGIKNQDTKFSFDFNGNDISNININTALKLNIEEVQKGVDILDQSVIRDYESEISKVVKADIENLMKKISEFNCDFININETFNMQHPYKYNSMKDNWLNELKNAKVNVNVKSEIRRTYDIININGEVK